MDHDFWMGQDLPLVPHAKELVVLMLPGWEASKGVAREREAARAANIPVRYVHYDAV